MNENEPLQEINVYDVRTFFYLWEHGTAKNGTEIAKSYDIPKKCNIREDMHKSHNYDGDYNNRHYYNLALKNEEVVIFDGVHYSLKNLNFDSATKSILDWLVKTNPEIIYLFYKKTKMTFLEWANIAIEKVGKPIINSDKIDEISEYEAIKFHVERMMKQ